MNEQVSRALDFWLGIPLCWLLTLWRRANGWLMRHTEESIPPKKILFIKLAEMGAIALAMPAFEAARRRVGRENLFCVVLETNREMHDLIEFFPSQNVWSIRDNSLRSFVLDMRRLMHECRAHGIDTVIDLEGFARISAILSLLTGARTRVGFHRYLTEGLYRGDLYTHRVAFNYYLHASQQFLSLVEALDFAPDVDVLLKQPILIEDYRLPAFVSTDLETQTVLSRLETQLGRVFTRPLIVLNPSLTDLLPLRRWPRENFVELARRITDDHPQATLVLIGLPREREAARQFVAELSPRRVCSLAGQTTVRELVTLFASADLLISSDSGPAHMAAFTDLPIISIFGPETPQLYSPLSPHNTSLWAGLACSPCLTAFNHRRSACQANVCMTALTVGAVYEAACCACPGLAANPMPQDATRDVR